MKKRILFPVFLLALALMACSFSIDLPNTVHGSGKTASEERSVSGFERVALHTSGEMSIEQGEKESLTIEADDNVLPYIRSEVHGDELSIDFKDNVSFIDASKIRYHLVVKDLSALVLSGSASVSCSQLKSEELKIIISGSGDVSLRKLEAKQLKSDISGSGKIDLEGKTEEQTIELSGSGDYRAGDLESEKATVLVSGSGRVRVWARESLNASISGSGDVSYYGTPNIAQSVSGSGKLVGLGEK